MIKVKVNNSDITEDHYEDYPDIKIKIGSSDLSEDEVSIDPDIKIKIGGDFSFDEAAEEVADQIIIRINSDFDEVVEDDQLDEPDIKIKVNGEITEDDSDIADPIRVKIGSGLELEQDEDPTDQPADAPAKIKIKIDNDNVLNHGPKQVTDEDKPTQKVIKLVGRKTLNGDVMVFDHKDIDIVFRLSKNKIVAYPKDELVETAYETQLRLFNYLAQKGIVEQESIQGGNMFLSMEAKVLESDRYNIPQIVLFSLGKWIEQERPYFEWQEEWEEEQERRLLEPEEGEYTEFDPERYHAAEKGVLRPKLIPFGSPGMYRW